MTYLAAIQSIITSMKPSPPNFIYERQDFANIKVDALSPVRPVVVYVQDYLGSLLVNRDMRESQTMTIAFLYKTEFEMDEMVQNAPLRNKAKELAKQFIKLMVLSNLFQITNVRYSLVFDRYFDSAYVGVALQIDAQLQPGECITPSWTESLTVTPSAAQNIAKTSNVLSYVVGGNTDWAVTSNQAWCVVTPASGFEEGTITATISANTSGVSRTAILTITCIGAGNTLTRTIIQAGV